MDGNSRKTWTLEEDQMLAHLAELHKPQWTHIAKLLGTNRTGKQCRERWENQVNPEINKGPWSEDEDRLLIEYQRQFGNQWAKISKLLPGRSANAIKNHWNSSLVRLAEDPASQANKRPRTSDTMDTSTTRFTVGTAAPGGAPAPPFAPGLSMQAPFMGQPPGMDHQHPFQAPPPPFPPFHGFPSPITPQPVRAMNPTSPQTTVPPPWGPPMTAPLPIPTTRDRSLTLPNPFHIGMPQRPYFPVTNAPVQSSSTPSAPLPTSPAPAPSPSQAKDLMISDIVLGAAPVVEPSAFSRELPPLYPKPQAPPPAELNFDILRARLEGRTEQSENTNAMMSEMPPPTTTTSGSGSGSDFSLTADPSPGDRGLLTQRMDMSISYTAQTKGLLDLPRGMFLSGSGSSSSTARTPSEGQSQSSSRPGSLEFKDALPIPPEPGGRLVLPADVASICSPYRDYPWMSERLFNDIPSNPPSLPASSPSSNPPSLPASEPGSKRSSASVDVKQYLNPLMFGSGLSTPDTGSKRSSLEAKSSFPGVVVFQPQLSKTETQDGSSNSMVL